MKLLVLCIVAGAWCCTSCVNDADPGTRLNGPTQAVVGPDGLVYVGDGYYNSRIVVYRTDGSYVRSWGSRGFARGQFNNPHGLAFTGDTLVVADRDNGRIQRFTTDGKYIDTWQSEQLGRPWSIAVAADNTIVAADGGDQDADNPRSGLVRLGANGQVLCRFGGYGSGVDQLNEAHSIAVSASGDIFVVDLGNNRIRKFIPTGECEYQVVPWPQVPAGTKYEPLGIAADGDRVYIAQQGKGEPILVFHAGTGEFVEEIGRGLFTRAHGVFVDGEQTIWVADVYADRVYRLSRSGAVVLEIGGREQ